MHAEAHAPVGHLLQLAVLQARGVRPPHPQPHPQRREARRTRVVNGNELQEMTRWEGDWQGRRGVEGVMRTRTGKIMVTNL